jgi:hypothetical protein
MAAYDLDGFPGHVDEDLSEQDAALSAEPEVATPPVSSARAGALAVPPPNAEVFGLLTLGEDMSIPPDLLNALLVALEGDDSTSVEDFGFLTPEELDDACDKMLNAEGNPISAIVRCKIRKLHFRASQIALTPSGPGAPSALGSDPESQG